MDPSNLSKVLVTWQFRPDYLLWGSDRVSLRVLFRQGDSAPSAGRRGTRVWSAPDTEGSAILPRFPFPSGSKASSPQFQVNFKLSRSSISLVQSPPLDLLQRPLVKNCGAQIFSCEVGGLLAVGSAPLSVDDPDPQSWLPRRYRELGPATTEPRLHPNQNLWVEGKKGAQRCHFPVIPPTFFSQQIRY